MVVVIANAVLKEGKGAEFIQAANICIAATRQEAGNLSYCLLQDTADSSKFSFVEEWESKADLDAHMQTPHFGAFGKASEPLVAEPLDIKIYDATLL